MNVLITGGTGLIGTELSTQLINKGYQVTILSRNPSLNKIVPDARIVSWDGMSLKGWAQEMDQVDVVVNLAGASIGEGRWTSERKNEIYASRINAGKAIFNAIKLAKGRKRVLLQASAVGYYGNSGECILDETSPPGNDFLSKLCMAWEASTANVEQFSVRRIVLRTGLVLTPKAGVLRKLLLPFRFFAGGKYGNGEQWWPWIHIVDQINSMIYLIENEKASGVFNLTAPQPIKMKDFGKTLARALSRPYCAPIPGFILEIALGEMSKIILEGQRALPIRLLNTGYTFKFEYLSGALEDLLKIDLKSLLFNN